MKGPVIPFREGLAIHQPDNRDEDEDEEIVLEGVDLDFDIFPLPIEVTKFLINNEAEIANMVNVSRKTASSSDSSLQFKERLITCFEKESDDVDRIKQETASDCLQILLIVSFRWDSKRVGPNVLIESKSNNNQMRRLFNKSTESTKFEFENNVLNGFQLAMNEGPLASESMQGVLVVLRKSETSQDVDIDESKVSLISQEESSHLLVI